MEIIEQHCVRCNKTLPIENFAAKKDKMNVFNKQCISCTTKRKVARDKNKCSHGRIKTVCHDCDGPNICVHKKNISYCVECGGNSLCTHDKKKSQCKECDIKSFLKTTLMGRMNEITKQSKFTYLGCTMDEFVTHIKKQFKEDMNFSNHRDVWHLSYKLPIGISGLEQDEIIRRFHYTNIYPSYPHTSKKKVNEEEEEEESEIKSSLKSTLMVRMKRLDKKSKITYIGCTMDEFISYLENQFEEHMNLDNYCYIWHIRYKLPLTKGLEQVIMKKSFFYLNFLYRV
jgi:Uri superfamily endonuclease